MDTTIDDFLGGRIKLKQRDYRATSDAVLLSAACPVKESETVLDVGCGTGAVALCIKAREADCRIVGLDNQPEMVQFSKENAKLNQMDFEVVLADVKKPPKEWRDRQFNHVVTNPPYFTESFKRQNQVTAKAHKQDVLLADWLDFCIKKVKAKGTLTIIHRAEAVPQILSTLSGRMGKIILVPLWPKEGKNPKRVLIQATQNSNSPFVLHPGFILHKEDNSRTDIMEDIMRKGQRLIL